MSCKQSADAQAIQVAIRARPLPHEEQHLSVVQMIDDNIILSNKDASHRFAFDACFASHQLGDVPYADQAYVFDKAGRPLLEHCLAGYNCCLLAYGQTGSGKTYSVLGEETADPGQDHRGILPRLLTELFAHLERECASNKDSMFQIKLGCCEVYCENVQDLLTEQQQTSLEVLSNGDVKGLTWFSINTYDDFRGILYRAMQKRVTKKTAMNARSSRSHAVFLLDLKRMFKEDGLPTTKRSRITIADLAGSENIKSAQTSRRESGSINQSLLSLGSVIETLSAISQSSSASPPSARKPPPTNIQHIYRKSKLTMILKPCLGGNARTIMLATINPAQDHYYQTKSTLYYASTTKAIVNYASVNVDKQASTIREYQLEIDLLRKQLVAARQDTSTEDNEKVQQLLGQIAELEDKQHLSEAEWQRQLDEMKQQNQEELDRIMELNKKMEQELGQKDREVSDLTRRLEEITRELEHTRRKQEVLGDTQPRAQAWATTSITTQPMQKVSEADPPRNLESLASSVRLCNGATGSTVTKSSQDGVGARKNFSEASTTKRQGKGTPGKVARQLPLPPTASAPTRSRSARVQPQLPTSATITPRASVERSLHGKNQLNIQSLTSPPLSSTPRQAPAMRQSQSLIIDSKQTSAVPSDLPVSPQSQTFDPSQDLIHTSFWPGNGACHTNETAELQDQQLPVSDLNIIQQAAWQANPDTKVDATLPASPLPASRASTDESKVFDVLVLDSAEVAPSALATGRLYEEARDVEVASRLYLMRNDAALGNEANSYNGQSGNGPKMKDVTATHPTYTDGSAILERNMALSTALAQHVEHLTRDVGATMAEIDSSNDVKADLQHTETILQQQLTQTNSQEERMQLQRQLQQARAWIQSVEEAQQAAAEKLMTTSENVTNLDNALARLRAQRRALAQALQQEREAINVIFLMDVTNSMRSWIERAQQDIQRMIDVLVDAMQSLELFRLRLAFVGYRDYEDEFLTRHPQQIVSFDFFEATNVEQMASFQHWIMTLHPTGGQDQPEDVAGGLEEALRFFASGPPAMTRVLIHVGDAPCHGKSFHAIKHDHYPEGDGRDPLKLVAQLAELRVNYFFLNVDDSTRMMASAFQQAARAKTGVFEILDMQDERQQQAFAGLIANQVINAFITSEEQRTRASQLVSTALASTL
eukprot:m.189528 g.189528  ORF g.189528 m.189528 type:complete len:1168 (-) comp16746_c0_seq2:220-3723(-)